MPTVSVIIPAFNASHWIAETLESVLRQDYSDFEVIVVNDGSTDHTGEVVAQFKNVHCVHKSNGGLGSARNAGIRVAQGDYIAFVDSDDLWFPDKLSQQVALLCSTNLQWVYCDGYGFDGISGQTLFRFGHVMKLHAGYVLQSLFFNCFIPSPTPMIARRVFEEVGYFDETPIIHMREDWDMWLRIAVKYPIGLVNRPLVRYRVHRGGNTAREDPHLTLASQLIVLEKALARSPKQLGPYRKIALARLNVGAGKSLARRGNLVEARKAFSQAVWLNPVVWEAYIYWLGCWLGQPTLNLAIRLRHWWRRELAQARK